MQSSTLAGLSWRRALSLMAGLGMMAAAGLTIQHYFAANFASVPASACDLGSFINCDTSSYSPLAQIAGVPLGFFGLMVGALLALGAVFPSAELERTNTALAAANALAVLGLAGYSLLVYRSLCLYCGVYWLLSLLSLGLFWTRGARDGESAATRLRPSFRHLTAFGVVVLAGGFGVRRYHDAKLQLVVAEYFALPAMPSPSLLSPYWSVRSTARFEDAPIQLIEYGDFLCSDCLYLFHEVERLKREFAGQLNVAFQFFPLEKACNDASRRDLHPHACEVSYVAAHDPARFSEIHDEIFAHFQSAKRDSAWRAGLARRYDAEAALTDTAVQGLITRIAATGREYAPTSPTDPRGIHATPTMILNHRMIIGTLPYEQLRAISQALVDRRSAGRREYLERWVP